MRFSFVKRKGNCVVHYLDKYAKNVVDFMTSIEDPPDWLRSHLTCDVS